uniref:(northern house mosquito) hypothetical protein n=1 Tax=Culex pipiens TaxID=7175 RepID=A0A8D8C5M4_CULPI
MCRAQRLVVAGIVGLLAQRARVQNRLNLHQQCVHLLVRQVGLLQRAVQVVLHTFHSCFPEATLVRGLGGVELPVYSADLAEVRDLALQQLRLQQLVQLLQLAISSDEVCASVRPHHGHVSSSSNKPMQCAQKGLSRERRHQFEVQCLRRHAYKQSDVCLHRRSHSALFQ